MFFCKTGMLSSFEETIYACNYLCMQSTKSISREFESPLREGHIEREREREREREEVSCFGGNVAM